MSEIQQTKKAWQRPENWVSWGFLALVGYGVLRGLDFVLPLLNRVLENLLYTSVLAGAVALIGYVLVSKDFHKLAWYAYRMAMRKLTELFVTIDPIAILRGYIDHLKDNLEKMRESVASLRAQKRALEQIIEENEREYDQNMATARKAKASLDKDGMKRTLVLSSRKAGRLKDSNLTYRGLLNKLDGHLALAEKMKEAAEFMIEDITSTVDVEEKKRAAIRASYKAMASARRILQGDAQREMYDAAMEHLANDYFQKIGEIEQFMEDSQHFVNTMDLQNGVYEEDALEKLEEWERRSEKLMSGEARVRVAAPDQEEGDGEESPRKDRQSFANLFEAGKK